MTNDGPGYSVAAGIERVDACPACASRDHDVVLEQPDELFPTGLLTLVACRDCRLVFLNPRMTQLAMIELESRSDTYEFDALELEREVAARVSLLESLRGVAPKRERLLDVGCNRGLLLEAAKRLGWKPVGVELSPAAAARARDLTGVPVYEDLADIPPAGGFDLVVAWHVLEHTSAPVAFLNQIRGLLAPGGVLALQVPSFDFVDSFREQGRLGSIVCAVHNLYFTEAALAETVRRARFRQCTLSNSDRDLMLTAFVGTSRRAHVLRRV